MVKCTIAVRVKSNTLSNPDKMFEQAIAYVNTIQDRLPDGLAFYGELLNKPKHNTLAYDRVPLHNIALFGIAEQFGSKFYNCHSDIVRWATELQVEAVPILYKGEVNDMDQFADLLDRVSFLGKAKIEGVVVKNYNKQFLLGGQPMPLMAGKFVSEEFKEVHRNSWKQENTGPGRWTAFKESYRTEARWAKAIQHLADKGELENDPRDIGKLIKEVQHDITEEEKEEIKNFLWKEFRGELLRRATAGLPEFHKEQLVKRSFEKDAT